MSFNVGLKARMSPRQAQAQTEVSEGKQLTPVGKKAEFAGLTPGEPVTVEYQVDRHDTEAAQRATQSN